MIDYLKPYDDMCALSFAVSDIFVEPITNALCKAMDFVLIERSKLKIFPNPRFNGNEVYYLYNNKKDERAFLLVVQGIADYYGISIKCKTDEKTLFYDTIKLYLAENHEYTSIPFLKLDDFKDQLREYTGIVQNSIENDLRKAGLIE